MNLKTTLVPILAGLLLATTIPTASAEGPCNYTGPEREIVCAAEGTVRNAVYCVDPNKPDCPGDNIVEELLWSVGYSFDNCFPYSEDCWLQMAALAQLLDELGLGR